jgi:hypothetical protein
MEKMRNIAIIAHGALNFVFFLVATYRERSRSRKNHAS